MSAEAFLDAVRERFAAETVAAQRRVPARDRPRPGPSRSPAPTSSSSARPTSCYACATSPPTSPRWVSSTRTLLTTSRPGAARRPCCATPTQERVSWPRAFAASGSRSSSPRAPPILRSTRGSAKLLGRASDAVRLVRRVHGVADERIGLDDAEGKWRTLVKVARSRRELDLRDLATGLRARRLPAGALAGAADRPSSRRPSTAPRARSSTTSSSSTLSPGSWRNGASAAAARRLFVAMSRARSRLTRGRGISTKFWRKDATRRRLAAHVRPGAAERWVPILEPHHARHLGPVGARPGLGLRAPPSTWSRTDDIITVDSEELPVMDRGGRRCRRRPDRRGVRSVRPPLLVRRPCARTAPVAV